MSPPTIPAGTTQAVAPQTGTYNFTTPWYTFFQNLLTYVGSLPSTSGLQTIPTLQWYVSATGNDANNGQSPATAFLTISHALSVIYSYFWNNQQPTLNVGAGTFAAFTIYGAAPGGGPNDAAELLLVGAGVGSTIIQAGTLIRDARLNISGITWDCTAAAAGFSADGTSVVIVSGAIGFSGNSASADCWSLNQFSSVIHNAGTITVSGTMGIYFFGFNTANYECNSASGVVITGSIVSFATLDICANMHSYNASVSFSGGSASGNAYICEENSVLEGWGTLDATWVSAGGEAGQLLAGGRSASSATAPSVVSATGLGSGSASISGTGSAYGIALTLSPTGSPSSSGNVVVQINEFLVNPSGASPYIAGLQDGSGGWSASATVRVVNVALNNGNRQYTLVWQNSGSNLTAGSTYHINLIGQN